MIRAMNLPRYQTPARDDKRTGKREHTRKIERCINWLLQQEPDVAKLFVAQSNSEHFATSTENLSNGVLWNIRWTKILVDTKWGIWNLFRTLTTDIPVVFSANPPTKIVLQPGGRSLVIGIGVVGAGGISVTDFSWMTSFTIMFSGGTMPPSWAIPIPPIIPNCKGKEEK